MFALLLTLPLTACTKANQGFLERLDGGGNVQADLDTTDDQGQPPPTDTGTAPGCPTGEIRCSGACTRVSSDPKNCGKCGEACKSGEACLAGSCLGGSTRGCKDGSDEQTFGQGMVGCGGRVPFDQRTSLCASGYRVCTASEWVDRRDGKRPDNIYWTDDNLRYGGPGSSNCYVSLTQGQSCPTNEPMRVCNDRMDKFYNGCNWRNCGFQKTSPNEYFGGCQNNRTAGALCCPQ